MMSIKKKSKFPKHSRRQSTGKATGKKIKKII